MSYSKQRNEWNVGGTNQGSAQTKSFYHNITADDFFDRFCEHCSFVIEKLALDKTNGMKCPRCHHCVEYLDQVGGTLSRCVRCTSYIPCTVKFCNLCGRENYFFDPEKPARLEKAKELKLRAKFKEELKECLSLSQDCVNDGDFETNAEDKVGISANTSPQPSKNCENSQKDGNME